MATATKKATCAISRRLAMRRADRGMVEPPDGSVRLRRFYVAKGSTPGPLFVPQFLGRTDHLEKLLAIAVRIFADAALGQLERGGVGQVAFVLRVPQHHAEAGDRRGELHVARG